MNSLDLSLTLLFILIIAMSLSNKREIAILIITILSSVIIMNNVKIPQCKDSYFTKLLSKCNLGESNKNDDCNIFKKNLLNNNLESNPIHDDMDDDSIEDKIESILLESKQKADENLDETHESFSNVNPPDKHTHKNLIYSEENYKYNLFDELGSLGDNKLAHKMKQMSNKNREAMDNFSRTYRKNSNINYFAQELKDASASNGWWDDDVRLSSKF
jgi:hypothetical protein